MKIGGLQKLTLIDYPGKIAATVFTLGCNFRCRYCHNPELIEEKKGKLKIETEEFFRFLNSRKGLLEGVCITGGEPTLQPDLKDFIKRIKGLDFLVKLDTNGSRPEVLIDLISSSVLDYIAMDVKSSADSYSKVTGKKIDLAAIRESISLIKKSGLCYEFRMTVFPELEVEEEIKKISPWLKGAKLFAVQQFNNSLTLDKSLKKLPLLSIRDLERLTALIKPFVKKVVLRNV